MNPQTPEELLALRYGQSVSWQPAPWNDTLDVIHRHRSVRRWLDKPVSDDTVRTLISAAQSAASSSNKQIISVIAVRDAEAKAGLAEVGRQMFPHIKEAPVVLIWCIDYSRAKFLAQGAELGALDYMDETALGFLDAGIAAQTATLAAESLGLGTVFLGSMRNDGERVQEILNLPDMLVPVVGLSIGHPDQSEPAGIKPRLPQELVLHWDRYGQEPKKELLDAYDTALDRYYSRYGQHQLWSKQFVARLGAKSITKTNRQFLRRVLEKAGFGLK